MKYIKTLIVLMICFGFATDNERSETIRKIFDASLENGQSYENLRELCKDVGHRLTGSHGDTLAVLWAEKKMIDMGYSNVRKQEFETNFWTRGKGANGKIIDQNDEIQISVLALGSSVGTGKDGLRAGIVEVNSWEEMESKKNLLKGKIVFYNRRMNPKNINTFHSYGETVDQRSRGASAAAKYGAVAALVRSVTLSNDDFAHTGNMRYSDESFNIPGLAISAQDANELERRLAINPNLEN